MNLDSNKKYKEFLENLPKYFHSTLDLYNPDLVKSFHESLKKAKRVFFTGTGSSLPSALYGAQYCSEVMGLPAQFLPNGGILSVKLKKEDLVFLSTQGFNRGDAELVTKKVKEDGAVLAVLTANQESPFKNLADFLFFFTPFPEKVFCRPVGVQTGILAIQKILTDDFSEENFVVAFQNAKLQQRIIFNKHAKYIVLSSGVGMPVAINYSLALREGCGIDSQVYDIETYGHGMYVSDQTEKANGKNVCYILINISTNDHLHASCERIKPFVVQSGSGLIYINSTLTTPYAYYEILTNLAENVYATNIEYNYDMNAPFGKEANRYYHKTETYKLTNRKLEEFIAKIQSESTKSNSPILVEISGGSCTGKSTFIELIKNTFESVQIIPQDSYQLGKDFSDRKTSQYKYDDLRNFQIEKCYADMKHLLSNMTINIPNFNLVENIQIGINELSPKQINILEGVYASYGELGNLSNYKLYIEAPYYIRFLRRIARFVNSNQNTDVSIPLRHITTFVYLAHKDFVIKQRREADLILKADEVLPKFENIISDENISLDKMLFKKEDTEIGTIKSTEAQIYFIIKQDKKVVYKVEVESDAVQFLSTVDWLEM